MKTTLLRTAILAAAPTLLVGCRAGYEVDIRNLTDQPITARIAAPHADGAGVSRARGRIGPGDRARLYTQTDYNERVWLEVDFEGNVGYPPILDLNQGLTAVNVRRIDEGAKGKIQLEAIPRP